MIENVIKKYVFHAHFGYGFNINTKIEWFRSIAFTDPLRYFSGSRMNGICWVSLWESNTGGKQNVCSRYYSICLRAFHTRIKILI